MQVQTLQRQLAAMGPGPLSLHPCIVGGMGCSLLRKFFVVLLGIFRNILLIMGLSGLQNNGHKARL